MTASRLARVAAVFGLAAGTCGLYIGLAVLYPQATIAIAIARLLLGFFAFGAALFGALAAFREPL
jgi:hypothetical protein